MSVSTDYVVPRRPGGRDAWSEEAAQHGLIGSQRLLDVAEVVPPEEVANALNLGEGEAVVVRRRLILLDQRPVEMADSYYPTDIARGTALAERRKIRGGAVTLLAELGHHARHIREDVSSRMPTDEERAFLDLGDNQPVLVLFRLITGADGLPVEVSVMTMVGQGHHLRYELAT